MISKNREAISSFVVYFRVKENEKINKELITPVIQNFFKAKNIKNYEALQGQNAISDLDFKTVEFCYFYDYILSEIAKDQDDKVSFPVKYSITLDRKNCSKQCQKTSVFYDEIVLSEKPVFYFIYIDIEDIFSFLREEK